MAIKYRTALAPSSQYSSREGSTVDTFQVHHMAALWASGLATLTGTARVVSSTWGVGGGEIVLNVPLDKRPFVSGSPYWDRRSESAEVANNAIGRKWTVADEDFDNLARVIADWSTRRGVPINDSTVVTHQELYTRHGASYATACPGDLQRRKPELLKLANQYKAGGTASSPASGLAWPFAWYTVRSGDTMTSIARDHHMGLSRLERLNPSVTNPRALQIGARIKVALDQIPIKPKIDNIPGPETYGALEQAMGVEVNKSLGRDDVRKLQRLMNSKRKIPVKVTGTLTDETMDALASWVAAPRSQVWAKVQRQLRNGTGTWR